MTNIEKRILLRALKEYNAYIPFQKNVELAESGRVASDYIENYDYKDNEVIWFHSSCFPWAVTKEGYNFWAFILRFYAMVSFFCIEKNGLGLQYNQDSIKKIIIGLANFDDRKTLGVINNFFARIRCK